MVDILHLFAALGQCVILLTQWCGVVRMQKEQQTKCKPMLLY